MKNKIKLLAIFLATTTATLADNEVFDGQDVSGEDFSGGSHKNSSWVGVQAESTDFSNSNFSDSNFSNANLSNSDFNGANIENANFANANLSGVIFISANLTDTQLRSAANITKIDLGFHDITDFDLSGLNLTGARLDCADLKNVNFTNANLSEVDFKIVKNLTEAQLRSASNITKAQFTSISLSKFNLSELNLTGVWFWKTTLIRTDFSNADLSNTNFLEVNLKNASFANANLTNAKFSTKNNIQGTNFTNANLSNVYFDSTLALAGVDLRGAEMSSIRSTPIYKNAIMSDGVIKNFSMESADDNFVIRKYIPATSGGEMISAKVSEADSVIKGGAKLTLEQGAFFEVANGKTLTVASDGLIQIDTDLSGSTIFNVNSSSGLVFEDGAVLAVNIIDDIITSDAYTIAVISFEDDSIIAGLNNFIKDETLFLTVNGEKFNGAWDYTIKGNELSISINVPEPATYAAIFGALALAFAAYRRRK